MWLKNAKCPKLNNKLLLRYNTNLPIAYSIFAFSICSKHMLTKEKWLFNPLSQNITHINNNNAECVGLLVRLKLRSDQKRTQMDHVLRKHDVTLHRRHWSVPVLYARHVTCVWPVMILRERERVYLPQNKEHTYKNILNISTVAGYQKGKPIKLVAYSTNYIGCSCTIQQYNKTFKHTCKWMCKVQPICLGEN